MKIGVPKEIKTNENRIALVPAGAETLVGAGHSVLIETGAGLGSGFSDEDFAAVGATIAPDADAVWRESEMIMKVKEPIRVEWPRMRKGQLLFTYFHFAADEELTRAHLKSGAICVAYETVELPTRELPLLTPMSECMGCTSGPAPKLLVTRSKRSIPSSRTSPPADFRSRSSRWARASSRGRSRCPSRA